MPTTQLSQERKRRAYMAKGSLSSERLFFFDIKEKYKKNTFE